MQRGLLTDSRKWQALSADSPNAIDCVHLPDVNAFSESKINDSNLEIESACVNALIGLNPITNKQKMDPKITLRFKIIPYYRFVMPRIVR